MKAIMNAALIALLAGSAHAEGPAHQTPDTIHPIDCALPALTDPKFSYHSATDGPEKKIVAIQRAVCEALRFNPGQMGGTLLG
jgi:hypothetical protein